ncbi:histone deacetylase 15-like isoform X1 [Zingiber officinale]|uniref:histone deacetylase 15-like isoform X1 n=1 Tax=Zingiber officinale TaxID=94328 RepID=UPI001C4B52CF|nr:histone deacetylase 15-like isoform X1 [Zingiber officinale]XP_042430361.1 histone deacetylase 15-like isoform X1 [Zingiber officinale]XP_042430362.1 histone deacetylase 15-like isoform X1 [Zingiber officinale]
MASETLCTSLKGKKICGENKVNEIHLRECQSCSYESHDKFHSMCGNGSTNLSGCLHKGSAQNLGPLSAMPNQLDLPSEIPVDRPISKQRMKHERDSTLQELYLQDEYDDEDDSDWEPVSPFIIKKWFCTNCTMPNFDDVCHCEVCGEDRECEFFRLGPSESPIQQEVKLAINSDGSHSHQDLCSKSRTVIGFDERMLLHTEVEMKSHPHPERPDRLKAIASSLAVAGIFPGKCYAIPAREITKEELLRVHTLDHIEAVQHTSHMLASYFTADTYANEHSASASRLAAGLCADLACTILSGSAKNGFALVRPPGHHAGVAQAMGFCLHNNAAVASLAAQSAGAKKILIVDWDVHHGNGTQEIFEGNKSVLYISLHRHENGRFYPGTGAVDEVGSMDGEGFSVNIPWNCGGVGDKDYIFSFQHVVIPIALQFDPDITIVSAGFDAARGDPLGCCDVTPAGYAQMTHMLSSVSQGKLLVILEGGYNLRSISSSATAVVKVLLGENPSPRLNDNVPSKAGLQTILQVMEVQMKYWPILKPDFMMLQSQWNMVAAASRDQIKRLARPIGPVWWKWGTKQFIYKRVYGKPYWRRRLRFRVG